MIITDEQHRLSPTQTSQRNTVLPTQIVLFHYYRAGTKTIKTPRQSNNE